MIFFRCRYALLFWGSRSLEMGNDLIHPEDLTSVFPPNKFLVWKSQELGAEWPSSSCMWPELSHPEQLPAVLPVLPPIV